MKKVASFPSCNATFQVALKFCQKQSKTSKWIQRSTGSLKGTRLAGTWDHSIGMTRCDLLQIIVQIKQLSAGWRTSVCQHPIAIIGSTRSGGHGQLGIRTIGSLVLSKVNQRVAPHSQIRDALGDRQRCDIGTGWKRSDWHCPHQFSRCCSASDGKLWLWLSFRNCLVTTLGCVCHCTGHIAKIRWLRIQKIPRSGQSWVFHFGSQLCNWNSLFLSLHQQTTEIHSVLRCPSGSGHSWSELKKRRL